MTETLTRREEYSEATRQALLDSAQGLLVERGFHGTSLDDVAAAARLTKGAIYHHFSNKQALFEGVLERLHEEKREAVLAAMSSEVGAWNQVVAGLRCFLTNCLDPAYQRICFVEGPTAMGFAHWWDFGKHCELELVRLGVDALAAEGLVEVEELDVLTHVLFGSIVAAALRIAQADNAEEVCNQIDAVMRRLVWGLRPSAGSGGV
jgi:AcrR family transcriptional regulator